MPRIQDIFFMGALHGVIMPFVWNLAYSESIGQLISKGKYTEVLSGCKAHQSRPIRRPAGAPSPVGHKRQYRWQSLWSREPCDRPQIRGGRRRGLAAWCVEEKGCALVPSFLIPSAVPFRRTPPTLPKTPHSIRLVPLHSVGPQIAPAIPNCLKRTRVAARIWAVFVWALCFCSQALRSIQRWICCWRDGDYRGGRDGWLHCCCFGGCVIAVAQGPA